MYQLHYTHNFKRQLKKVLRSGECSRERIEYIIDILVSGISIGSSLRNHKLHGKYKDMWECHVRPDVLLIYEKSEEEKLITLVALGSHSELFK